MWRGLMIDGSFGMHDIVPMEQVSSMVSNGGGSVAMQRDDEYRNRIMKIRRLARKEVLKNGAGHFSSLVNLGLQLSTSLVRPIKFSINLAFSAVAKENKNFSQLLRRMLGMLAKWRARILHIDPARIP
uniref:HDC08468 n=1 Tax=Drosophila melanogaster TaxID=7227 RepID=Q6ILS9_DROME|nr:TPA_inf: HDC08468 [Drosophila melanogaster]